MSETPENSGEIARTNGAVDTPKAGEIVSRPAEKFARYVQQRAELEAPIVAEQLAFDQMESILAATTPEEIDKAMQIMGVVGLRTFDNGAEIEILGYHLAPGSREEFKNRLGVFAVMHVRVLATGETAFVDTGIERVIAYLRACELMERFPLPVRVMKQQTGRGNDMITLGPLPPRVGQGRTGKPEPEKATR
jgi:hypothetical protein